jgi:tetratricopeptide (TPR) repeat protein
VAEADAAPGAIPGGLTGAPAGEAYERTLALDPGREEAAFNLGNCHFVRSAYREAVSAYERATTLDAEYVEGWNNLGIACAELERPEEATGSLRHALALAPEYADAHFNLAETLASAADFDAAREHWEAYLAQDPNSSWAREVRARLARL